mmetsp:Transcript_87020/g.150601  ORF Transcript_87020/g.150601 Transcript_87020/m.150601 type:complete len:325 (-) Transcript_87020:231-1205(-)
MAQAYANKFPKGGKKSVQDGIDHQACVFVVEALVKDPSLGPAVKIFIEGNNQKQQDQQSGSKDRWPSSYCYLSKISKEWMTEWLEKHSPDGLATKLSRSMLNKVDASDKTAIPKLFHFVTCTSGSDKLPRAALDKAVCAGMLVARTKQAGVGINRWSKVFAAIASNGQIDYKILSAYSLHFDERGKVDSVTHCGGVTVHPPAHVFIDRSFELQSAENDFAARVVKKPSEFVLADLFTDKEQAPWVCKLDSKGLALNELALNEEKRMSDLRQALEREQVQGDSDVLADAIKERRAAAVKANREKREKMEQDGHISKKRRTSVVFN